MAQNRKAYLIKRIIVTNSISLLIVLGVYLWVVYILSHANSFWDLIRGKEVYEQTDSVPPVKPFLATIPEKTQLDHIDISGSAEPGVKITLYLDQTESNNTTADANGTFSFTGIPISTFATKIYVTATDESGNVSTPSTEYTVTQDLEPPEYKILEPENKETNHESTVHSYVVKGTTEKGATVLINENHALVNQNGEFTATIKLEQGGNELNFIIKDEAGNETKDYRFINFHKID